MCRGTRRILINDRLDIALSSGSAGVHLSRASIPLNDVVRWCRAGNAPSDFQIGASCHSLAEAREAQTAGASYIVLGPVFDTPSKRPFGSPLGMELLREVCHSIQIPVVAIGGVDRENSEECVLAGASGIAAIRLFQEAANVQELERAIALIHRLPRA